MASFLIGAIIIGLAVYLLIKHVRQSAQGECGSCSSGESCCGGSGENCACKGQTG